MASIKVLNMVCKATDILKEITTAGLQMQIDSKTFGNCHEVHIWRCGMDNVMLSYDGYQSYFLNAADLDLLPSRIYALHDKSPDWYQSCIDASTEDNELPAFPVYSVRTKAGDELVGFAQSYGHDVICWIEKKLYDRMMKHIRKGCQVQAYYNHSSRSVIIYADQVLIGFIMCCKYNAND